MLERIVRLVEEQVALAVEFNGEKPKRLIISEELLTYLARKHPEIWELPQFKTLVHSTTRVLNRFLVQGVDVTLQIIPDHREIFFRLEV